MALGFTATNITDKKVKPDKGLTKASTPVVRQMKFGDGYEQRAVLGINNISEIFTITFSSREKSEADDIMAFFDSKGAVTAFDFTIPDTNSTTVVTGTVNVPGGTSSTAVILDAATTNLDISPGATVTGSGISGTVKVSGISGVNLTLDTSQSIADNVTLTFTNPNERSIKVVCKTYNMLYVTGDYYTINGTFERVYEP